MNKKRILLAGLAVILLGVCVMGYQSASRSREYTRQIFAMDTVMEITAYGPHGKEAVDAAVTEIQRLDQLLSTGNPDSEISQINASGSGVLSPDMAALTAAALRVYQDTNGLFDCTVYPLMELWGFPSGEYHVPSEAELAALLPLTDASQMLFDGTSLTLAEGQRIDFGGIAKGYTAARIMEIFRERGVTSGMVSLGGNVQVLGEKPDGTAWRIGVRDPEGASYLGVLSLRDRAAVTSGGYERYFEENGRTYIHILDPRTGCPAESDLLSVTIVSPDGALADALSTALYIMGLEDAAAYWRACGEDFEMVLVDQEHHIYVTEGISADFQAEGMLVLYRNET